MRLTKDQLWKAVVEFLRLNLYTFLPRATATALLVMLVPVIGALIYDGSTSLETLMNFFGGWLPYLIATSGSGLLLGSAAASANYIIAKIPGKITTPTIEILSTSSLKIAPAIYMILVLPYAMGPEALVGTLDAITPWGLILGTTAFSLVFGSVVTLFSYFAKNHYRSGREIADLSTICVLASLGVGVILTLILNPADLSMADLLIVYGGMGLTTAIVGIGYPPVKNLISSLLSQARVKELLASHEQQPFSPTQPSTYPLLMPRLLHKLPGLYQEPPGKYTSLAQQDQRGLSASLNKLFELFRRHPYLFTYKVIILPGVELGFNMAAYLILFQILQGYYDGDATVEQFHKDMYLATFLGAIYGGGKYIGFAALTTTLNTLIAELEQHLEPENSLRIEKMEDVTAGREKETDPLLLIDGSDEENSSSDNKDGYQIP